MKTYYVDINGTQYSLDIQKAVKDGVLKAMVKPEVGQIYYDNYDDVYLILSVIDVKTIAFVNLADGTLWDNSVKVKNVNKISEDEWCKLKGDGEYIVWVANCFNDLFTTQ